MAFSVDSLSFDTLGALTLLAATIWSWRMAQGLRAGIRIPLRFAAVLLAAFAASLALPAPGLAFNVALLTIGVAGAALALSACFQPSAPSWLSATMLACTFAAGLIASLAAMPLLVLACISGMAALIAAAARARIGDDLVTGMIAMAGAMSLILGGLAVMGGGLAQAALFFAASLALLTRTLKKPVAIADARIDLPVGGKRA